jgi:hypothetical protein
VFKELSLGNIHGKKSAGEDLTCDVKTLSELQVVISGVRVQLKGELELVQCGSEQLVNGED